MANKVENKIGCQAGKTKIVDPNNFYGFNSESNLSVPLEDLNISVILKTKRKGRTVLTSSGDEATTGTKESSSTMIINFIEGSTVANKKVLTTNYTDLTALASDGSNDEALGITNIEIDFNSSMAPMVNINFVDVRGSAIFQNEQNISGNNTANKYSTFFQLPYPKFELEIKGYYGKPVTYCLHMLKFNSKFNSQTGNFEISCQFIGYTYAMLSDMLMGYLKAIPFTKIGGEIQERYNTERGYDVLTLVELMKKIQKINEGVEKIAADSPNADAYGNGEDSLNDLDAVYSTIALLGTSLDINGKVDAKDKYPFIVRKIGDFTADENSNIETYKTNVTDNIKLFNEKNAGASLEENYFLRFETLNTNKGLYSDITQDMVDPANIASVDQEALKLKLGNPTDFDGLKKDIFELLSKDYTVGKTTQLNVYNMNGLYDKIDVARASVNKQIKANKELLADELKQTVADTLGFEPTVRRLIEVFTTAIEVFMETIYTVSTAAEAKDNNDRTAQLEAKFGTNIVNSDIKKPNLEIKEFFAWPDYREKDEKTQTYVDKYLGEPGVLDRPQDVDELIFIDDLLQAFLKAQQLSNEVSQDMEEGETTWYPVNPIDTSVFLDTEPYARAELLSENDVVRLMLIRGMTFLGYTNDSTTLDPTEIVGMAIAEADAIVRGVTNRNVRQTLSTLKLDAIKKVQGTINSVARDVVKRGTTIDGAAVSPFYYYDYIFQGFGKADSFKLIPISGGFNNESWGIVNQKVTSQNVNYFPTVPVLQIPGVTPLQIPGVNTANAATTTTESTVNTNINYSNLQKRNEDTGDLFLTNYSSAYGESAGGSQPTTQYYKYLDGGMYVKIIRLDEYDTTRQLYPIEGVKNDIIPLKKDILNNRVLSAAQVKEAGFNTFAGPLGMQEYSLVDFGDGVASPLKFIFYRDNRPGLAYTRAASGGKKSVFDLDSNPTQIPDNLQSINYDIYTSVLHKEWGNNRKLFVELLSDTSKITYPFVTLMFQWIQSESDREPAMTDQANDSGLSLFGSTIYYNQTSEYAKAMLFLHTLPFVGNGIDQDSQTDSPGVADDWPETITYIRHLFDVRGGFIQAPRLWCAYIGSILWRMSTDESEMTGSQQTGGGSGSSDPINWRKNVSSNNTVEYYVKPNRSNYITSVYAEGKNYSGPVVISKRDLLNTLPMQVKNEFKKVFFEFVNGNGNFTSWETIKNGLEVWGGNGSSFETLLKNSYTDLSQINSLKNKDKYVVITPQTIYAERDNFRLELKGGYDTNESVKILINALVEEVIVVNNNFNIWRGPLKTEFGTGGDWRGNLREEIYADEKNVFDVYFSAVIKRLTDTADSFSPTNEKKDLEQQIFGTANEDTIKLQLYKTCKNIHDKWLAGTTDPKAIIFQCGVNNRSRVDGELALKYGSAATPRLIDSFRFISRSFRDIGDLLYVNPLPINNFLLDNPNTSSYDAISQLLSDNNFDFIALPTFINFRDAKEVEAIFTPYPNYEKAIEAGTCGPSFVCAYVGQKSQHLDYSSSDYPNDGFDLRCLNGDIDPSVPDDFKTDSELHEDPVGAFIVRYSQQNQNIFKDINLDQSEFSETDESLQIQDDISQKGADTNRTIAGQNLYNVYAVRSYTAEIEMMGNAMMQPMMYFQLDNIPMFHGAYMVTRVRHSIKPNHMSTNFTGVRIRYAETPLITAMDLYMSFVDSLELSGGNGSGGGGGLSGQFDAAYKADLVANLPKDKTIIGTFTETQKEALTTRARQEIANWQSGKLDEKNGTAFLDVYAKATPGPSADQYATNAQPWSGVFISYLMLGADSSFPKSAAHYGYITDAMNGKAGYEVFPFKSGLKIKVERGDIFNKPRSGGPTASHSDVVYSVSGDKAYLVGGNLGDSVGLLEISIKNGYIDDTVDVGDYVLIMKQTGNKYYNSKKLIGTGTVETTRNNGCKPLVFTPKVPIETKLVYENIKTQTQLSDMAIAGIMGNMFAESRFIPTAYNSGGGGCGAYGFVQWRAGRQSKMIDYAKASNLTSNSYIAQIGYINKELVETWTYTREALVNNATSPELAAKIFHQTYEAGNLGTIGFKISTIENGSTPVVRTTRAREFYNMIQSGNFTNFS
jgi:hypothetical protein